MTAIIAIQIIVSLSLIVAILLQNSGGGLGSAFGAGASYHTKRGVEKGLFMTTIVLASLFTLISIVALITK